MSEMWNRPPTLKFLVVAYMIHTTLNNDILAALVRALISG